MKRGPWSTGLVIAAALALASPGRPAGAPAAGDAVVNSLGMRMVLVPAGQFRMGSPFGEAMRQDEEIPRRVAISRDFRMAATEVTQRQWLALMPQNRSPRQGDDLPVTSVSWMEAQEFCRKLSQKEGGTYRLPTEAEWEYACRGGGEPSPGGAEIEAFAWYADNSGEATHPVGLKRPNPWGLHDLLGNVAEWTQDVYGPYLRVDEIEDPAGPATGSARAVRGGSWRAFRPALRCAARVGTPESYQLPHVGLRVVQEIR